MDGAREDVQVVGVRVDNTENRLKWKTMIRCGNPWKGTSRMEKKIFFVIMNTIVGCLIMPFGAFFPYLSCCIVSS